MTKKFLSKKNASKMRPEIPTSKLLKEAEIGKLEAS